MLAPTHPQLRSSQCLFYLLCVRRKKPWRQGAWPDLPTACTCMCVCVSRKWAREAEEALSYTSPPPHLHRALTYPAHNMAVRAGSRLDSYAEDRDSACVYAGAKVQKGSFYVRK